MSEAKAPKKVETAPKSVEAAKPVVTKSEAAKPDAAKSETTASDTATPESSPKKAEPSAKSASQESISHFSSVSTPEYRSGWDKIFGVKKDFAETTLDNTKNETKNQEVPSKMTLRDADVNAELRALLDEAFEIFARNNGINIGDIKKSTALEYNIDCVIL